MLNGAKPILYRSKKANFFNYKYSIIPIFKSSHWILAIVEYSDEKIEETDAPCTTKIRIFDSKLSLNLRKSCQDLCLNFFVREIERKFKTKKAEVLIDENFRFIELDQGINNSWDCGPFTIYHFHKFFTDVLKVKSEISLPSDPLNVGPFIRNFINFCAAKGINSASINENQIFNASNFFSDFCNAFNDKKLEETGTKEKDSVSQSDLLTNVSSENYLPEILSEKLMKGSTTEINHLEQQSGLLTVELKHIPDQLINSIPSKLNTNQKEDIIIKRKELSFIPNLEPELESIINSILNKKNSNSFDSGKEKMDKELFEESFEVITKTLKDSSDADKDNFRIALKRKAEYSDISDDNLTDVETKRDEYLKTHDDGFDSELTEFAEILTPPSSNKIMKTEDLLKSSLLAQSNK